MCVCTCERVLRMCALITHMHGRRGALKLATSTKDFKTESESRPTYIQGEI